MTEINPTKEEILLFLNAARDRDFAVLDAFLEKYGLENIDVQNNHEWTALGLAAYKGNVDVVEYLLVRGADETRKSAAGDTPEQWAGFMGHRDVAVFIHNWAAEQEKKKAERDRLELREGRISHLKNKKMKSPFKRER